MTWFEWVMIFWLGVAAIWGWRAGFIFTAGNLFGFGISLWVAKNYAARVAVWVGGGAWGSVLASIGLVLGVTKLGGVVALIINRLAKITYLIPFVKTFNRLLGGVFSLVTHALIISLVAYLVDSIILEPVILEPWAKVFVSAGAVMARSLPNSLQGVL